MDKKVKVKLRLKPWAKYSILSIFILIFAFSSYKIVKYFIESKKVNDIIKEVTVEVKTDTTEGTDNAELINPPKEDESKKSDYWTFIKTPYVDVDFNQLKEKNKDTVAWLYVNNTNINYPIVQTTNNEYYLKRAFDKSYNGAGWLFMDYKNSSSNFGVNTIIYGHSMLNTTMFGTLWKTRKSNWYTNKGNWVIKLSTPEYYTLWQVVSIYTIEAEGYYITTDFENDAKIDEFHNTILSRSMHNFNTSLNTNDKILTLSTCTSGYNNRYVVHSRLIKKEARTD